jgi:hypothetical protein
VPTLDQIAADIRRSDALACTVVTRSHLRYAWVLRESLRAHHPDLPFCVLVVDALDGDPLPEEAHFDCPLVRLSAFLNRAVDEMTVSYTAYELCGNIKPYFLAHLFRATEARRLLYLDSDLYITGPLWAALGTLDLHLATCAPHTLSPIADDGREPSDLTVAANGAFNTGFMGFARAPEVTQLLAWMGERVHRYGFNAFGRGMFCEQRFFNLGVIFLQDRFRPIFHRGYNVGYWNLHERTLEHRDGLHLVDGERVAFFHLSGFEPEQPDRLSKHEQRHTVATHPQAAPLRRLLEEYRDRFAAVPFPVHEGYRFDHRDGLRLTPELRHIFHQRGSLQGALRLDEAMAIGERHLAEGEPQKARDIYSRIIARHPRNVAALHGLARVCEATGDRGMAQRLYFQILAVEPGHADAARRLGLPDSARSS